MDRFPCDAEAREERVIELIDARIHAIKFDILIGRVSTTEAVLERLQLDDTEDDARRVLWTAVVGGSCAVGVDNASAVQAAIYFEAEALAELDVADMERRRRDESLVARAERWLCDRGMLA